jgi:hypothetical protein
VSRESVRTGRERGEAIPRHTLCREGEGHGRPKFGAGSGPSRQLALGADGPVASNPIQRRVRTTDSPRAPMVQAAESRACARA